MDKRNFTLSLNKEIVDKAVEIQKNFSGSSNLSSLIDKVLAEWILEMRTVAEELHNLNLKKKSKGGYKRNLVS